MMDKDLERELHLLAERVPATADLTDRVGRQTHGMVTRIRRRRATRTGVLSVVSVTALVGVVSGGLELVGFGTQHGATPAGPWMTASTDEPTARKGATEPRAGVSACGASIADIGWVSTGAFDMQVTASPEARADGGVTLTTVVTGPSDAEPASLTFGGPDLVAVDPATQLVVGYVPPDYVPSGSAAAGATTSDVDATRSELLRTSQSTPIWDCAAAADAPTTLPPGSYDLYTAQQVILAPSSGTITGDSTLAVGGPFPLLLATGGNPDYVDGAEFPGCGASTADAAFTVPQPLRLTAAVPPVLKAGADTPFEATLTAVGANVLGNRAPTVTLALAQDGIVQGHVTPDDAVDFDLSAGKALPLSGLASATACDGGTLPAGAYTAWPVLTVLLKEVTAVGGGAADGSTTTRVVVGTDPVEVTVR